MKSAEHEMLIEGMIAIRNILEGRLTFTDRSNQERSEAALKIASAMHNLEVGNEVATSVAQNKLSELLKNDFRVALILPITEAWLLAST